MTKFNTGNPVGSADPRDRHDNSQAFDQGMNSESPRFNDRLGRSRKSWQAFENQVEQQQSEFNADQADREQRFNAFIAASGYTGTGANGATEDYAAGIEFTEYNQVVRDSNGEIWRVSGSAELPYTTTGAGLPEGGAFVSVGDAVLRQELNANTAGNGSDLITHTGTSDTVTEALDKRVKIGEKDIYATHYGFSPSNTSAENDTAFTNFVAACSEGSRAIIDGGDYEMSASGFEFTEAVTLECLGQVYINLSTADETDFLTFAWSAGKPYANHIKGMLTINANDSGRDTVVMRGINWSVDDRVVIRNSGRDGFVLRTSSLNNWFIENFSINQLEIDGAQRNGLAYDLALKSSGSFINEGLIQSLEVREAGKGGEGVEIAYLVPENTYSANKISSVVYLKSNIDLRSASRTEPYAVAVKKTGGAVNGSVVEHQMFINGSWENVAGTIPGSSAVFVDANTVAGNWKFIDIFTSDIDLFSSGEPLAGSFIIDRQGYINTSKVQTSGSTSAWKIGNKSNRLSQLHIQTEDSGLSGNVDTTGDELILENSGSVGMTLLSPSSASGRVLFGDEVSPASGQLRYLHATDEMQIVTAGNKVISQDANGNILPGSTGAQDIGSEANRFQHSHFSRMKIVDGISEPTASAGWAYIYVDSGTGDLRVKFGDGTVKNIVTDV